MPSSRRRAAVILRTVRRPASAQYNWGYPAVLKNALDHWYAERSGKPLMIVSSGGHGGGKCAAQLRQMAERLHMLPLPTMPAITLTQQMIAGGPLDPGTQLHAHAEDVRRAFGELSAPLKPGVDE